MIWRFGKPVDRYCLAGNMISCLKWCAVSLFAGRVGYGMIVGKGAYKVRMTGLSGYLLLPAGGKDGEGSL
jgi:hypothetical protein